MSTDIGRYPLLFRVSPVSSGLVLASYPSAQKYLPLGGKSVKILPNKL